MITIDIDMPGRCFTCPLSYTIQTGEYTGNLMCKALELNHEIKDCLVDIRLDHRPENCPIVEEEQQEGRDLGNMISIAEYAEKIGKAKISVADKCRRGTMPGAQKVGRDWFVPADAEYPDLRVKNGNYVGRHWKPKEDEQITGK